MRMEITGDCCVPMISVIIPYYNVEQSLLDKCISSILEQTYGDFEIILIDDGSTEEYIPFVDSLGGRDSRIKVYHQENKGVSAARNRGVELSRGKYITFIDPDDAIVPYFFAEAYEIIQSTGADEVIGANQMTDDLDAEIERSSPVNYYILEGDDRFKFRPHLMGVLYYVGESGAVGRGPVARLLSSEIARAVRFNPKLKIGEDGVWNLEILNLCRKVCYADQVWYKYYRNPQSATHKFNPDIIRQCEDYFAEIPMYIDIDNNNEYFGYVSRILELLWLFVYKNYLAHPGNKLAKEERRQAIQHLYTTSPWTMICESRFIKLASKKEKIKGFLYKHHLLFAFWDIKGKLKSLKER